MEAAVVAHGDRIHVLGGATAETGAVARHEAYLPGDDGWRVLAPLPGPVAGAGAATGQGRIYVAGGIDEAGRPLGEAHAYDSRTNAWTALPPLPRARRRAVARRRRGPARRRSPAAASGC